MIYDGQGQSDPEFTKEVADSLGAFATANQWSVDNIKNNLDQKNLLIEQLHNDMQQMEVTPEIKSILIWIKSDRVLNNRLSS
jgi:hypothetical protein